MRHSLLGLVLLLGGCLAPRVHVDEWTDVAVMQKVDVWTKGRHWRLHGVTVLLDSVTGIPADAPLECDSCRVGFPRSQIDSVVTRHTSEILRGIATQALAIAYLMGPAALLPVCPRPIYLMLPR